jgi:ankyrin repeat protein
VTYERSAKENLEAVKMLVDELGLDPNGPNSEGRTPLMGAAMKGRNDVVQFLVDKGAKLETHDKGNRDTDKVSSAAAGTRGRRSITPKGSFASACSLLSCGLKRRSSFAS